MVGLQPLQTSSVPVIGAKSNATLPFVLSARRMVVL